MICSKHKSKRNSAQAAKRNKLRTNNKTKQAQEESVFGKNKNF